MKIILIFGSPKIKKPVDNQLIESLQTTHINVWKKKNRQERDSLMRSIYADNIKMYDKDFILNGIEEVSDFIDKLQQDPEFDFAATEPINFTQNGARLFWNIKTGQGLLSGMDFLLMENEKVTHIYVFMNVVK